MDSTDIETRIAVSAKINEEIFEFFGCKESDRSGYIIVYLNGMYWQQHKFGVAWAKENKPALDHTAYHYLFFQPDEEREYVHDNPTKYCKEKLVMFRLKGLFSDESESYFVFDIDKEVKFGSEVKFEGDGLIKD